MAVDQLPDLQLRALVVDVLDHNPDATFAQVLAHLRTRQGRVLEEAESDRLHEVYEAELAHPTGAHRIGAKEAAHVASGRAGPPHRRTPHRRQGGGARRLPPAVPSASYGAGRTCRRPAAPDRASAQHYPGRGQPHHRGGQRWVIL
jgi:hypothetical protein